MAGASAFGSNPAFLTAGGDMGARMRAHDWSTSPLGLPDRWPQSLRTVVDIVLNARFPMFAVWGDELGFLYNDAYADILGAKHPAALGARFADVWSDAWAELKPLVDASLAGEATYLQDWPLRTTRKGYDEQTWFTFSYSPVQDESGRIAGMFCACTETTQRVLANRRADAERERQRHMLREMPGFVGMLSGPDLVYEYVNDAYVAISERTDFVGRRFRDVFADITGQGFHELFENVFRSGEGVVTRGMELRLHGRADTQYVDFVLEPIRDDDGAVTGVFVGGYETTDVYRGNEALRTSEARYRTLFENIDAGFCVVEVIFDEQGRPIDHRFVEINPAFERQSGLQNALGRTAREILPEHEQHWFDIYGEIVRTGEPARFENGSDALGRWFDVHAMRVGTREQRRVAVLFNNITQRKKAEDGLRELNATLEQRVSAGLAERKLLADLVEGTDAFVQVADRDYRWLAINRAAAAEFERIYGVRPKVGDSMLDLLAASPEHRDAVKAVWGRALAGEQFTEVGEFGDPGRDRRCYEMKYNVLRDAEGAMIGAYQFVYDVTDRVQQQRRLAEAEEALRQAQKMEAMGQLTGGVAHDFNNLLTPIIGSLDMLIRRGVGNEREQRLIDGALQSADRAKTLVQRLLAFARRQPLQPVSVDLERLVDDMTGLIGSTLGPAIDVRVELEPDLPLALADPNQLEMAVLNLAVNARDAMPDGGVLTISAAREAVRSGHRAKLRQGHYVRLSVSDTGVGMDEATLARAIEPFFSTKGIGKGTGLGLSMAHGLASQLNGGLAIDSRPGEGTVVQLWLPISLAAIDKDERPIAPTVQPKRLGTALLVDDEDLVRMSTADMLMDLGYEVVEASSAKEALRLVGGGLRPDLLVTDHLMPGMTGVELASALRSEWPTLPILVVSGYAEGDGVAPGLPRLTKPFRNAELAASLAALAPAAL